MIDKEKLKDYAAKLMFEMDEEEYTTLQEEFSTILSQMDLIGKIPNISEVEPMSFPFENSNAKLREDEVEDYLTVGEVLENTNHQIDDQVKVPRVVEE